MLDDKGLGMWIMSKVVIAVFLFSLILVLSNFLLIYQQKAIADTAKGRTKLWAEVANSVASYQSAADSVYLPKSIRIRDTSRKYTIGIRRVTSGTIGNEEKRIVFLMVFRDSGNLSEINRKGGFSAASTLVLPSEIEHSKVFNWTGGPGAGYQEVLGESRALLIRPSKPTSEVRDQSLLFYRNKTAFCVGQKPEGTPMDVAMSELGEKCTRE